MHKSPAFSTSFLESRMIQKLKSRKSRIKPGLFAFLLAERIIFGKKTQKSSRAPCGPGWIFRECGIRTREGPSVKKTSRWDVFRAWIFSGAASTGSLAGDHPAMAGTWPTLSHQTESGRNSRSDSFFFPTAVLAPQTASKVSTPPKNPERESGRDF